MSARVRLFAAGLLLAWTAGCGDAALHATRYKAEKLLWQAERAESQARLEQAQPDSLTLLALRDRYLDIPERIRVPEVRSSDPATVALHLELTRLLATAELQGARLALRAGRPDLAVEAARRIAASAGRDSLAARRADFFLVATYREMGREEDAIALMRQMLKRYRPLPPERPGEEDALLSVPEAIVRMRKDAQDAEGTRAAMVEAVAYYRSLLTVSRSPELEAQIRGRIVRVVLELGNETEGLRELDALQALVERTPSLSGLKPELQYSEAKLEALRSARTNPERAVAMLERFVSDYPTAPQAARAKFEAGVLLEGSGRRREALERYRTVAERYPDDKEITPTAVFRRAMLEEQFGGWEVSKNLLESIPHMYPHTRAALEAPLAIVNRYVRQRDPKAAEAAVARAIETYRTLLEGDTASTYAPLYSWNIYRCQVTLSDWKDAIGTVDEMARLYPGHPVVAQALLEGAKLANQHKDKATASRFLGRFLTLYPASPLAPDVRRELAALGTGSPS